MPHVAGSGGGSGGGAAPLGMQPLSSIVEGTMESDCTQGTPLQSFKAGIAFAEVQAPVQPAGASNVVVLPEHRGWLWAVKISGKAHDPAGGSHVQAPHVTGGAATNSA